MVTCKQVSDSASDVLDGPTTFSQRLSLRLHLLMCKHCRRYVRQIQLVSGVARALARPPEPSEQEIEELIDKLR